MGLNDQLPEDTDQVIVAISDPEESSSLGVVKAQGIGDENALLFGTQYADADAARSARWWSELLDRLKKLNLLGQVAANTTPLTTTTELIPHLNEIKDGINDLKHGQAAIYRKIDRANRDSLEQIISLVQAGRIDQGEMTRTLDAIRRALRLMQSNDAEIMAATQKAKEAVESDLGLEQKLELSLPIIPLFLQYKVELSVNSETDLDAIRQEVLARWNALKQQIHK